MEATRMAGQLITQQGKASLQVTCMSQLRPTAAFPVLPNMVRDRSEFDKEVKSHHKVNTAIYSKV